VQVLFRYLHPRDRRACLPISTPYNVSYYFNPLPTSSTACPPYSAREEGRPLFCCKGRLRTSTKRLGFGSDLRLVFSLKSETTLCSIIFTPEKGGHVCQFHHLTMFISISNSSPTFHRNFCCRGRVRTSTEQLGRQKAGLYPVISTLETGGLVCQFQHPTRYFLSLSSHLQPPVVKSLTK
jgi:hypothetical protein